MNNKEGLKELLKQPNVIDFHAPFTPSLANWIESIPNSYLGKLIGNFAIVYTSASEEVENILSNITTNRINMYPTILGLLDERGLDSSGIIQIQDQPYLQLKGRGVLLGFIDTGIDYTKEEFKHEDGTTKVKYIWDQTLDGNAPDTYYYGAEYNEEEINAALKMENPYNKVPHKDEVGHGTFLASLAGGRNVNENMSAAPFSEFIVVKLRKARDYYLKRYLIPDEVENAFESTDVMLGIEYIIEKAHELNMPVAICIGIGTTFDGHDSFSVLETYLTLVAQKTGVCICAAGGNESHSRHHTSSTLSDEIKVKEFGIKVGDESQSFPIYIWNNPSDRISVSVKSPSGEVVGRVPAKSGTILSSKLLLEKSTVVVEYYFPVEQSGSQLTIVKILKPTPGIWKVTVYGDIILDGTYHAWLPLTSLISPGIEFTEPNSNCTIVVPATAVGVITCGAYNSKNGSLYVNSSLGPTRLPSMAPDFVAPGVNIKGLLLDGYGSMTGTSVATAITTGACALMLQWGIVNRKDPTLNTYRIRAYLIRGCIRNNEANYPNDEWGYGRLNLLQTFNKLL